MKQPPVATKSNNVKRYVRAVWRANAAQKAAHKADADVSVARNRLTGAQTAEANRLLIPVFPAVIIHARD